MDEGQEEKREEYIRGLIASSLLLGLHDKKRLPPTNQPAAEKLLATIIADNKKHGLSCFLVTEDALKDAGVRPNFWERCASGNILLKATWRDKGELDGKTVFIFQDELIGCEFLTRLTVLAKPAPSVEEQNHQRS